MALATMIYEPEEDSLLLEKHVKKLATGKVLDMGTGTGIQAMAAASLTHVKEVVAVDLNPEAVEYVKSLKHFKIKTAESNLFSKVKGRFDTIIFNPPYLPLDEEDPDIALDGGKLGKELIEEFLKQASTHLTDNGTILMVLSNRTGDVEKIAQDNGYQFEMLERQGLPFFEELYVYKMWRADQGSLAKGKRGLVFRQGKEAIKCNNPKSKTNTLDNEAKFLKIVNKYGIGPKFLKYEAGKLHIEYIEGDLIDEYIKKSNKRQIIKVLNQVLDQCHKLDELSINKFEMQNPYKHIIVRKNKPVLIDFERARYTDNPKNVTQFLQFILSRSRILEDKKIKIDRNKFLKSGKDYKKDPSVLSAIKELLSSNSGK